MYFFRGKDSNRPKSFNLKVMHIVNYTVAIIFILGILYKLVEYIFFK